MYTYAYKNGKKAYFLVTQIQFLKWIRSQMSSSMSKLKQLVKIKHVSEIYELEDKYYFIF